jgi:hypothetical protein
LEKAGGDSDKSASDHQDKGSAVIAETSGKSDKRRAAARTAKGITGSAVGARFGVRPVRPFHFF